MSRILGWDELPRPVREIEHTWIGLSDGTRLGARIWLPHDAEADPVPAILEYLPYRKHDGTVSRDLDRQPYIAGHGYATVRVDMRGSGESDGILEDEYTQQEWDDALEVIAWLAAQPWCNGSVGMTGISWGGFNALQVAALRPPALRAIMTLCSTDDRYADDVHYRGGCVLATDMLHWASSMMTWNARPPDPAVLPETWREVWIDRLERTPPFIEQWLSHQRRDAYWKHGSVCEDYAAIEVPVYAVGGWADGYTNAVFRLLSGLSVPRKGLVGPWAHAFPDDALPGPSIGWLQECVRWWDQWLKGRETGIMDEPMLRAYVLRSVEPQPSYEVRPGRWVAEEEWPAPATELRNLPLEGEQTVRSPQTLGAEAGVWCAEGQSSDLAGDQRRDDALSACFDLESLAEETVLLGCPAVELELESDRPQALVCVRLCDVFPDGTSALVTRGLLNLSHRASHEQPEVLEPGRHYRIRVELDSVGYAVPTGHRLRVAVSSTYWPWAWPSPEPVTLKLHGGTLELPVRSPRPEDAELPPFAEPEHTPPLEKELQEAAPEGRTLRRDYASGRLEQRFNYDVGGTVRFVPIDLVSEESNSSTYSITEGDPLSAAVTFSAASGIARGDWSGGGEVEASMWADAEAFYVKTELTASESGAPVFRRRWEHRFPRDHV